MNLNHLPHFNTNLWSTLVCACLFCLNGFAAPGFSAAQGSYQGLFYDTNQVEQHSSGFISLRLRESGSYSGNIQMDSRRYRFSGQFDPGGLGTNLVFRRHTNDLLICMAVDLTPGSNRITGMITNNQVSAFNTNHAWRAEVTADRAVFSSRSNPAPWAGRHTMVIPATNTSLTGPEGDGYGKIRVSKSGRISLSGRLADDTRLVRSARISQHGMWPLYAPLYRGKGAVVSWISFDTNHPTTDLSGLLNWFKQGQPRARFYSSGFTNEVTAIGSRYIRPRKSRILDFATGEGSIDFIGAGVPDGFFLNDIFLSLDNQVFNYSPRAMVFEFSLANGLFHGKARPSNRFPASLEILKFHGVVLQKQEQGFGFFLRATNSGQVTIREQLIAPASGR